ncbi:TPA: hypothetical protein LUX75_004376 [Enterobacter hormaechei subsp. xiangfangensis]|mgnify:CR=1 FL=1|uniref:Core-binding (CB) domain-containing protein n=1 Tax=Enterobacter asburiae TaxID=61645 RepID=A0ABC9UFB9_ENTAS|nr:MULTISPECIES: hypothetical protein [Enterobacter cloacae complex]AZL64186.1 hypothetical protein EI562_15000 [Enterobacter asburiae]EJP6420087.1 hypothetical protein [Enterobacter hormaechei]EJV0700625.1 hypothetical protein [Enterobacter hormaechei]EKL0966550.1 hypothetical protein [Enterobacter hormaechei]EKU6466950.1 hypothetical protein [Enterobacter hormaechei]
MSSKLKLTTPWVEHLCIPIRNGANAHTLLDFNRFRYKGIPKTNLIKQGDEQLLARDDIVQSLFIAITGHEDVTPATKYNIFNAARKHFTFCDSQVPALIPLSESTFIRELKCHLLRQRRGEIKDSTASRIKADLTTLYNWMGRSTKFTSGFKNPGNTQSEPTRGYSDGDLKKLLPLLRGLFRQLYSQFILDPDSHIKASGITATMTFCWKGKTYPVRSGVSKLFYAAAYLLSYYTWSNSSILYTLKRPTLSSHTPSDNWHQMPAFKRRAFKTISVEIGDNNRLEIPKYATQFFDQLITASTLLDPGPDGLLLPTYSHRKKSVQMMSSCLLNDFKSSWLSVHFPMTDDLGQRLWPVTRRFRATGSHLTLALKGPVEAALRLDNTPETIRQAYSDGNPYENNQMNRDTSQTLEQVVRDRQSIESAKQKVREAQKVSVLAYEAYVRRASPPVRNSHGSYCNDTAGTMATMFTSRARRNGLIPPEETLACADLLNCWSCKHQVLVESVTDLWCVLSFREYLEESQYLHLDKAHYTKNFGQTIVNIDSRLKLLNQKTLQHARRKLADEGRHPLWSDVQSTDMT